jgi:hypothetical protein
MTADATPEKHATHLAGRSITTTIGDVVFSRPRGADRSEIVGSAASKETDYRNPPKDRGAADNPQNRCDVHGDPSIAHK